MGDHFILPGGCYPPVDHLPHPPLVGVFPDGCPVSPAGMTDHHFHLHQLLVRGADWTFTPSINGSGNSVAFAGSVGVHATDGTFSFSLGGSGDYSNGHSHISGAGVQIGINF